MESLPRCPWIFLQISFLDRKWILTTDLRKQSTLSDGKRVMIASLCLLAPVVHLQPVCTVCKCCNSACCYCAELHPNHSFANFCFWHFLAKKKYKWVWNFFLDLFLSNQNTRQTTQFSWEHSSSRDSYLKKIIVEKLVIKKS